MAYPDLCPCGKNFKQSPKHSLCFTCFTTQNGALEEAALACDRIVLKYESLLSNYSTGALISARECAQAIRDLKEPK